MRKTIYFGLSLLFVASTSWSQQGDWQTCQYQPNPQQCKQGVPVNQQVAPSSLPMQPSFSQGGTTSQGRQITPPLNNIQPVPTYQYNQPMNCGPNGYGGYICQ